MSRRGSKRGSGIVLGGRRRSIRRSRKIPRRKSRRMSRRKSKRGSGIVLGGRRKSRRNSKKRKLGGELIGGEVIGGKRIRNKKVKIGGCGDCGDKC